MIFHATAMAFTAQLLGFAPGGPPECTPPSLRHQARDTATVQRLEKAWTVAFLTGDEAFEKCLLIPDFTEVLSDGSVKHLDDELALARKNTGKGLRIPDLPPGTVLLHGSVAAAYGVSGSTRRARYVDYYVWERGGWRVFFAQQTLIAPKP